MKEVSEMASPHEELASVMRFVEDYWRGLDAELKRLEVLLSTVFRLTSGQGPATLEKLVGDPHQMKQQVITAAARIRQDTKLYHARLRSRLERLHDQLLSVEGKR